MRDDERPKFLNCIMTPEIIRDIRTRQEIWDKEHKRDSAEDTGWDGTAANKEE